MPFYNIFISRDGHMGTVPWATTYDLETMRVRIEEVEANFEGCDFIAVDEIGNTYVLLSDWEPL